MSIQNEVVERIICITKNSMWIMIKNAELLIEFWAKDAKTNVYLQNWIITRFLINEVLMISKKTFIEIKLSIDHVQVWECKCYSYIDLKSLSVEDRWDKFMNRDRLDIFMKYMKNIDKQYHFWISDLNRVIKNHAVKFAEDEKNEDMNLQLCKQTFNILSEQRSVRKSSKNNVSTNILKFDALMINISSESTDALKIIMINLIDVSSKSTDALNTIVINLNAFNSKITSHTSDEREVHMNVQITQKVFASSMFKSAVQIFLHVVILKKKRDSEDQQLKERAFKILQAMMIWLITEKVNNDESDFDISMSWALFNVDESDSSKVIRIFTLNIYKDVVQNSVWKKLWKEVINAELVMLVINEIWQEEVSLKKINIMTSKWVFKSKMYINDFLDKLKTRLIVRNFFQIHEVDYENTFTSIIKFDTLQVFLVIVTMKNLKLHQVNVNNAFTESFLKEIIYMFFLLEVKVRLDCALKVL